MRLPYEKVAKLKPGKIIYYSEYSPADEKTTFDDLLLVIGKGSYSGPLFKVLASKINEPGEELYADIFEIDNGRAYAVPDKDFIIKLIFDKDMW